eukprot:TRINITY_DN1571_c0_g1_i13.p3 TRINITY_DN1571_c0_g1~~TRINITY_DN1571_c0_g1_i13.p3  ORF type:complete len:135 (-),score=35.73 TRINITY_DN1571_c0_g1_i13:185-589(-)
MLLDTQKEITEWGKKNNVTIGADIMQMWNNAMQQGDENSYNQFIKGWNNIKVHPQEYKNSTAAPDPWRIAIMNQVEGQAMLASMLGIDMNKDLSTLNEKAKKEDVSHLDEMLETVMTTWKRLNDEISKRSKSKA